MLYIDVIVYCLKERVKSIEEAEESSRRIKVEEEKQEKMKLRSKLQEQSYVTGNYLDIPPYILGPRLHSRAYTLDIPLYPWP